MEIQLEKKYNITVAKDYIIGKTKELRECEVEKLNRMLDLNIDLYDKIYFIKLSYKILEELTCFEDDEMVKIIQHTEDLFEVVKYEEGK